MEFRELTNTCRPTEQAHVVVRLRSGVLVFGRTLQGTFCVYDYGQDCYFGFGDDDEDDGWKHVTHFCEIVPPDVPAAPPTVVK